MFFNLILLVFTRTRIVAVLTFTKFSQKRDFYKINMDLWWYGINNGEGLQFTLSAISQTPTHFESSSVQAAGIYNNLLHLSRTSISKVCSISISLILFDFKFNFCIVVSMTNCKSTIICWSRFRLIVNFSYHF